MSDNPAPKSNNEQSFMSHLIELRDRLMRMVLAILLIFLSLFYWANEIYTYLAEPLTSHLPEGSTMIAIDVASPFLTPFKLVLMLSIFLAMPVILFQLWAFVAPGLYKHEKRLAIPLLISSVLLFYMGIAFAYYVVFPLVFGFFTSIGPESVSIATDIGRYLDFVLSIFFGFGIAFEIPIATIILIALGLTTPEKLAEKRPFVIVGAFIVGMLLTPPDIISQVLLAVPMWILFESGLIAARYLLPKKEDNENEDDDPDPDPDPDKNTNTDFNTESDDTESDKKAESDKPAKVTIVGSEVVEDYDVIDDKFIPLTEEEMDAELDRMDEDDDDDFDSGDEDDDSKEVVKAKAKIKAKAKTKASVKKKAKPKAKAKTKSKPKAKAKVKAKAKAKPKTVSKTKPSKKAKAKAVVKKKAKPKAKPKS